MALELYLNRTWLGRGTRICMKKLKIRHGRGDIAGAVSGAEKKPDFGFLGAVVSDPTLLLRIFWQKHSIIP